MKQQYENNPGVSSIALEFAADPYRDGVSLGEAADIIASLERAGVPCQALLKILADINLADKVLNFFATHFDRPKRPQT